MPQDVEFSHHPERNNSMVHRDNSMVDQCMHKFGQTHPKHDLSRQLTSSVVTAASRPHLKNQVRPQPSSRAAS
eukprot:scaffold282323_cov33-Tisochrysis_lutea.AAC.1